MPQPKLTAADLSTFFVAGIAGIAAANLTWLALFSPNSSVLSALQTPLMPGLFGAYLLHGDADGSITVQGITPYIAVFLNAITYASAIMIPRLLWCHMQQTPRVDRSRLEAHMQMRLQTRLKDLT